MNIEKLNTQMQETLSVAELRRLLNLGKTESYWLIKKEGFEVVTLCGKLRITRKSFDEWYANQTRYSRIDGIPPGTKLRERSYTVPEVAKMLNVDLDTVYDRIHRREFETFLAEYKIRITRKSFEEWCRNRNKTTSPKKPEQKKLCRKAEPKEEIRPKPFYTLDELSEELGVRREYLYRLVRKGAIKAVKQRQGYMISSEEVGRIKEIEVK